MKPILVTGATGQQGGAAAAHLLAAGWPVRALVRDPDSPAAQALQAQGADLRIGDFDDVESLVKAADGAHGIFAVTTNDLDVEREVRRGRALADTAKAAGVAHLVFTSVGGAERDTKVPFWESKWEIEQYIHSLGLPATVLRPVRFMENHAYAGPVGGIVDGELLHFFPPESPVQLIAVTDIGAFAALAFTHPQEYLGQSIELAGDELTPLQAVDLVSQAVGHAITYRRVSADLLGVGPEAVASFEKYGVWQADIPALRRRHPGLLDFPTWLKQGGADRVRAILAMD
ncbi:NmrA/HSCARG family protein [Rhizohabitans arisaemae]|uniref:NmrA/HSCARG family protein n=1 Tax=Rhizohabitans arisaemae TaxID=2720610 RepID=UPI0024B20575|nr:NmrA/HSCARG family protein [Rhizohabitans arisaemae]